MHLPVVLVTGTSSGIGRAAVEHLRDAGCHVIATARNTDDIADLAGPHVQTMRLDVTDDATMTTCVDAVIAEHGRIDALVNNAGYGIMLPLEEIPVDSLRAQFETNVFGMHRLTQLVLPHMRRGGHGRIVNVSSAAGHISMPIMGAYCGTKFAVRAMTWALDGEVRRFGIRACLIEPGRIATKFGQRSVNESKGVSVDHDGPYAALHKNWDDVRFNAKGKDVRIIAKRIVHACTADRPKFHYLAPSDARGARFAARFLPDTLTSAMTRWFFWRGAQD